MRRSQRAERGGTGRLDVLLQHVAPFGTKFRAHGHLGFLFVIFAMRTGFLVVVTNGWPSALSGTTRTTRSTTLKVNIGKLHVIIFFKFLNNIIPAGSLLSSSASSFARNPTNKESMITIYSLRDQFVIIIVAVKLNGSVKVALRVDATQDEPDKAQQQKQSQLHVE